MASSQHLLVAIGHNKMPGSSNKNDSTHHMLNRNDKLKEQHVQQLKRIIAEQQRMSEALTKQVIIHFIRTTSSAPCRKLKPLIH